MIKNDNGKKDGNESQIFVEMNERCAKMEKELAAVGKKVDKLAKENTELRGEMARKVEKFERQISMLEGQNRLLAWQITNKRLDESRLDTQIDNDQSQALAMLLASRRHENLAAGELADGIWLSGENSKNKNSDIIEEENSDWPNDCERQYIDGNGPNQLELGGNGTLAELLTNYPEFGQFEKMQEMNNDELDGFGKTPPPLFNYDDDASTNKNHHLQKLATKEGTSFGNGQPSEIIQIHVAEEEKYSPKIRIYRSNELTKKIEAIEWAKKVSINSAARKFSVASKTVREWMKQEDRLKLQINSPGGGKRKRLGGGGRPIQHPEIDAALANWINEMRECNNPVSRRSIIDKANELFAGTNIKVSNGWLELFIKRHNCAEFLCSGN